MSKHGLSFSIEEAEVSVDEIAEYVAGHVFVGHISEAAMEELAHDITHSIMECVGKKVLMARADAEWKRIRRSWVQRNPPNHAGYYYCHICGGWVHEGEMELDHVVPKSVRGQGDPNRDENLRPSHHSCNYIKGSRQIESKTLEIRPPDGEI